MAQHRYRYELRSGISTIATGHLTGSETLVDGEQNEILGSVGIVRTVDRFLASRGSALSYNSIWRRWGRLRRAPVTTRLRTS